MFVNGSVEYAPNIAVPFMVNGNGASWKHRLFKVTRMRWIILDKLCHSQISMVPCFVAF